MESIKPFSKMMQHWQKTHAPNVSIANLYFTCGGKRVQPEDTPFSFGNIEALRNASFEVMVSRSRPTATPTTDSTQEVETNPTVQSELTQEASSSNPTGETKTLAEELPQLPARVTLTVTLADSAKVFKDYLIKPSSRILKMMTAFSKDRLNSQPIEQFRFVCDEMELSPDDTIESKLRKQAITGEAIEITVSRKEVCAAIEEAEIVKDGSVCSLVPGAEMSAETDSSKPKVVPQNSTEKMK